MREPTIHTAVRRTLGGSLILTGIFALTACGGGSSDGSSEGSLTLGVTDAPVDSANEVNVAFTGITLKPQDGDPVVFECDQPEGDPAFDCGGNGHRTIDLLALTGDDSETLLDGVTLDAGSYEWVRLQVDAGTPANGSPSGASNIVLDDGAQHELLIPSGQQSGLKLVNGFEVPTDGEASVTIDFDLRRAVTHANAGYVLKPALRLVDNSTAGHLAGEITNGFVQTNCPTGDASNGLGVYVYDGASATPGDLGDADHAPVTTASAELDTADGNYDYRIGFLPAGDYTVAVTCVAGDDEPETDETLDFVAQSDVTVRAESEPTVQNFN